MEELWKDIPGYEGLYQASNLGRIRSAPGKTTSSARYKVRVWKVRIIQPKKEKRCRNSNGYTDERVELWKDGTHRTMLVSRLVAMAWVDGYRPELTVNHIDGNPSNNTPENLEWITRSENIRKGFQEGLYDKSSKEVALISPTGEIHYFGTRKAASNFLGKNHAYLNNRQKRNYKTGIDSNGNHWLIKD